MAEEKKIEAAKPAAPKAVKAAAPKAEKAVKAPKAEVKAEVKPEAKAAVKPEVKAGAKSDVLETKAQNRLLKKYRTVIVPALVKEFGYTSVMVTLAKKGDLASRRQAARVIRPIVADEATGATALDKLFTEIGPRFASRKGGYTRIYKLGARRGDNAEVTLVRWTDK